MPAPVSRFIGGYANHRFNPFTAADMAVSKTEDHLPVPTSSPFCLQLLEVPRKEVPSTVSIYNYTDGIAMTEVATAPTLGQFRVDYPTPAGMGTGLIEFNSGDAGKDIRVEYKATGSPVVAEFWDAFVPWPTPSPGENQGVIFKAGAPAWSYFPKRYFHEGNALYHAGGEDESPVLFRFKKGPNDTKVFLELKGAKAHQGFYTELKEHGHGPGTLATAAGGVHAHDIFPHSHGAGSLAGSQGTHVHNYIQGPGPSTNTMAAGNEAVSIAGETGETGLGTQDGGGHSHNVTSGTSANAGGSPKTFPDQLKIYIDGADKTANILALLSGWTKLGDGTNAHDLVVAGTGEIDITSLLGAGAMHEIKITEPAAAAGGRVLLHLEVY